MTDINLQSLSQANGISPRLQEHHQATFDAMSNARESALNMAKLYLSQELTTDYERKMRDVEWYSRYLDGHYEAEE